MGINEGRDEKEKFFRSSTNHYGMDFYGDLIMKGGKEKKFEALRFAEGDTVKIKLDCLRKKIFYAVNKGQWTEVADVTVSKTPYYLGVAAYGEASVISLLNHTALNSDTKGDEKSALKEDEADGSL